MQSTNECHFQAPRLTPLAPTTTADQTGRGYVQLGHRAAMDREGKERRRKKGMHDAAQQIPEKATFLSRRHILF
jgi:hypothetical protein